MGFSAPDSSLAWLTPIFVIERFTPNTTLFLRLNAKENLSCDEDVLSMLASVDQSAQCLCVGILLQQHNSFSHTFTSFS